MRIGFGRLAQKSCPNCSKHLPPLLYTPAAAQLQYCRVLSGQELDQHGLILQARHRAFTTTATRLDAAERDLRRKDEAIKAVTQGDDSGMRTEEPAARPQKCATALKNVARKKMKHDKSDPNTYTSLLDKILPQHLQTEANFHHPQSSAASPLDKEALTFVVDTIQDASKRSHAGVNLLMYMGVKQRRWKAVVWLADALLRNVSSRMLGSRNDDTLSNIVWGSEGSSFDDLTQQPFSVGTFAPTNTRPLDESTALSVDPRYSDLASEHKDRTMSIIWNSLGNLIIEAAELSEQDSEIAMAVVYQIIAKVHALGLVPDNVYSYAKSDHNSMGQRPPILHLLSSRILTTLSDATWRSHQMDIIEQAVNTGTPLQSLIKDLPGGRFRLKVRPLGPEVWLEFVLWCCVEGGFGTSGTRIINLLQQQTREAWFAVPWTSPDGKAMSSTVDWDRVRSRHGGSVGLLEGYNREPPFVEMAPRTVSAEVVLSLIETMANSITIGSSSRSLGTNSVISNAIPSLVEFLEPHNLPGEYFDYLAVRVLQTGAFDVEKQPQRLERWVEKVAQLRSLETITKFAPATATFDVRSIVKQSEVHASMLHQSMEAYVDKFDVRNAVAVFNRIQELVDVSKLQSISAFLATTTIENDRCLDSHEFFTPHTSMNNVDFLHSHGQLPLHKLASFLNLTTDSKLLRIGEWLLYTDEVDEPVIPRRLYDTPGLTAALIRFAGVSGDEELLFKLITAGKRGSMLSSVSLLRSLVDAFLASYNFREAHKTLTRVRRAKGGGYGLSNFANSAAAILTLESRAKASNDAEVNEKLRQALQLINGMMTGYYDSRVGAYRKDVLAAFRQQNAALVLVLATIRGSQLSLLAGKWQVSHPLINGTTLSTQMFNVLLAGVVNTQGSSEGMRLWQLFCAGTVSESPGLEVTSFDEHPIEDNMFADDENYDPSSQVSPASDLVATSGEYIPFVEQDTNLALQLEREDDFNAQDMTESNSITFANSFPVVADEIEGFEDPQPRSLVRPDLRTLRIIVRGALAERRGLEEAAADSTLQREVLEWATLMFRLLGAEPEDIEQEIQQAIDENANSIQHQRIQRAKKDRFTAYARQRRKDESIYNPFRRPKMFLGMSGQPAAGKGTMAF